MNPINKINAADSFQWILELEANETRSIIDEMVNDPTGEPLCHIFSYLIAHNSYGTNKNTESYASYIAEKLISKIKDCSLSKEAISHLDKVAQSHFERFKKQVEKLPKFDFVMRNKRVSVNSLLLILESDAMKERYFRNMLGGEERLLEQTIDSTALETLCKYLETKNIDLFLSLETPLLEEVTRWAESFKMTDIASICSTIMIAQQQETRPAKKARHNPHEETVHVLQEQTPSAIANIAALPEIPSSQFQNLYNDLKDTWGKEIADLTLKIHPHPQEMQPWQGLKNVGSTCWSNTAIQFLTHSPQYDALLMQPIDWGKATCHPDTKYLLAMFRVFINLIRTNKKVSEDCMKNLLNRLANFWQECGLTSKTRAAHDAIEMLEQFLKRISNGKGLIEQEIKTTFDSGYIHKETVSQPFWNLRVYEKATIPHLFQQSMNPTTALHEGKKTWLVLTENSQISVDSEREAMTLLTSIGGQGTIIETVPTSTTYLLKPMFPEYLPLHLNRIGQFVYNKSDALPSIEEKITLKSGSKEATYELESAIYWGGGHYSFLKKIPNSKQWHWIDDSNVSKKDFKEIKNLLDQGALAVSYKKIVP